MGREAACTARIDGKLVKGKALLESAEIVFRGGEARLKLPFADLLEVKAAGGALTVRTSATEVTFLLGGDAEVWAAKIQNPPSRLAKLGVKAGLRVSVVGAIEPGFLDEARATGAQVFAGKAKDADLVFLVVDKPADLALARLKGLVGMLRPTGALWVIRQKGSDAPVTEAESRAAGLAAGLVDTKVVAFSATHTAERYVIPVAARR
jgi:hypothetical protein